MNDRLVKSFVKLKNEGFLKSLFFEKAVRLGIIS